MSQDPQFEILGKAHRLVVDIGQGDGPLVPQFHFNTKLSHCLTGWYKLVTEDPSRELHYRVWCDHAADFVAALPKTPATSSKTGEVMDPLRASREVFPTPEKPTAKNLYEITLAMHDCVRLAGGGDRKKHYGINQDHLNLVEIAAELGLVSADNVKPMTMRCLGKSETTAEALASFHAETNAGQLLAQRTEPTFTLLDDAPGQRAGVLKMLGNWGSDCRFPVAIVDTAREHLVITIEPKEGKGTSVTNMAEKIVAAMTTKAKHLRHPSQSVRFFEVYEDDIGQGSFSEVTVKNGQATWKAGEAHMAPKIMAAVRHACFVAAGEKPLPKSTLAQTLQKVKDHGFNLTVPAPIVPTTTRSNEGR